jgi:hypothetical protein
VEREKMAHDNMSAGREVVVPAGPREGSREKRHRVVTNTEDYSASDPAAITGRIATWGSRSKPNDLNQGEKG